MLRFSRMLKDRPRRHAPKPRPTLRLQVRSFEERCVPSVAFLQTNLVSDGFVPAANVDPNLVNPWGIAASPTTARGPGSPFWVADNGTGLSTLYNGSGTPQSLVVTIPPPMGSSGPATPTGIVFNGTSDFAVGQSSTGTPLPAIFIFATEDGTISGWNPGVDSTHAVLKVDNSANPTADNGAVYKGLAEGNSNGANYLYATNFRAGTVDVFDTNFQQDHFTTTTGGPAFTDSHIPAGFAPFGIRNIDGVLYVTYAKQDAAKHDDVAGQGNGFVDVFTTDGRLLSRLIRHGQLNSPWGLSIAPASFGQFAGDLLVGNFGNGRINVYNPVSGVFRGALKNADGQPIVIDGLWTLTTGNDGRGGDSMQVYFTAGLDGEQHGLFGSLQATVPSLVHLQNDLMADLQAGNLGTNGTHVWQNLQTAVQDVQSQLADAQLSPQIARQDIYLLTQMEDFLEARLTWLNALPSSVVDTLFGMDSLLSGQGLNGGM